MVFRKSSLKFFIYSSFVQNDDVVFFHKKLSVITEALFFCEVWWLPGCKYWCSDWDNIGLLCQLNHLYKHSKWGKWQEMVSPCSLIVRRAGLLWSQRDFEWRWSVPLFKCLTVLEFSFILFDLCLLITFFNFIMNYVPIVTFWIFTYHKIWILSIMFCSIWSYWIIYFLACLEVSWRVVS